MATTDDRYFSSGSDSESSDLQNWVPVLIGGALMLYGLSRRSKSGALVAAAGGAVAFQGARAKAAPSHSPARASILIGMSPNEVYTFWRELNNLPRFMKHLESVETTGDNRSKWTAIGPAGYRVTWEAEIVSDSPGKHIAWRSMPGSEIDVDGTVEFREAPGQRGTIVDVTTQYRTPAGAAGNMVAKLFGKDPAFLMKQDMRLLKALLEAGEIPTTEGQSHGPRSLIGKAARYLDPNEPAGGKEPERVNTTSGDEQRRVS
jgi:uncharacterized membrane protein